ncbi:PrsW family intramembrane metalloprotease [Herbiconiux sp. CPCC 205716]|uniref:PrsW family intramembrane metalloprotease n=1 Tax=Herbiconiux gentiana TaxID=2970912 RepID=A0ABT2GGB6_9MICO|nr:PrsW family intramembrane metalloprotease [Herbiconiux gentiana]MCS5715278.1 PrsW family intramembrane metalloprotease [Herbiconiux gentiana]
MSWLLVPLIVVGVIATAVANGPALAYSPVVTAAAIASQLLLAAVLLTVLRLVDPLGRPWMLVAAGVVWGGGICIALSATLNPQVDLLAAKLGVDPAITLSAPLIEELLKMLGVLALIGVGRRWLRHPIDGFVLGASVGIGLLAVENVTYGIQAAIDAEAAGVSTVEAVGQTLVVRSLLSIGSHGLYAAIIGYGLAALILAVGQGRVGRGVVVFAACFLGIGAAHLLWDVDWGLAQGPHLIPPALIAAALIAVSAVLLRRAARELRSGG